MYKNYKIINIIYNNITKKLCIHILYRSCFKYFIWILFYIFGMDFILNVLN